jgi:acetyl esterase/lipase
MQLSRRLVATTAALIMAALPLSAGAQGSRPLPETLSAEARAVLTARANAPEPSRTDLAARRAFLDKTQESFGAAQRKRYAVDVQTSTVAGVPVRWIRPAGKAKAGLVLLNLHGGGFNSDSGSLTENVPVAALTGIPVVAVLYRLMPEHPFPAGIEDGLAVYRELLKSHKPSQIAIYGTSAGAVMGPQLIARIRKEGLPQPAALGMFSGDTDLARTGDTMTMLGFDIGPSYRALAGASQVTDPAVSVAHGAVGYFPPTLCVSSSRDFYLSATSNFCRQLELAGVENKLVVFDGLPHAFWSYLATPESDQAFEVMAKFLLTRLEPKRR